MTLFKAHIVHPYTHVPLIVYFNESSGYLTFEKDQEVLQLLLQLEEELLQDKRFLTNLSKVSNLCQTQYPVSSFQDVYQFLEKLGIEEDELTFQQMYLH